MRKIFQLGGVLGLCFNTDNIDLSIFEGKLLGAYLPDGRIAMLQSMEIVFHKPDFSNIGDVAAHRASVVNLVFSDKYNDNENVSFEVNGAYFWRFLESVPEPFRILSDDNQTESYINESLKTVMLAARYVYKTCFINTTMENACVPPLSCLLDLETGSFHVVEALTLPDEERKIISGIVDKKLETLDLTVFVSEFVDGMLADGYLIHGFKSVGGGMMSPEFTPAKWDKAKHKTASDYLSELSCHTIGNCPAYTGWSEFLSYKLKDLVSQTFDELIATNVFQSNSDLTCAKKILESDGDLFEIQGANESVDIIASRAIVAMGQYLESLGSRH